MTSVVIPSIGRSPFLEPLLCTLVADPGVDDVYLIDNWVYDDTEFATAATRCMASHFPTKAHWWGLPGKSLYEVWNLGLLASRNRGHDIAVILNDDVVMPTGAVAALTHAMHAHPEHWIVGLDYSERRPLEHISFQGMRPALGTYRMGGIGGFAFAVWTQMVPMCDTQYEWWGGDDDWVWAIMEQGGSPAVAEGIPVRHPLPETTAITIPSLAGAKDRDRTRLLAKWGQTW